MSSKWSEASMVTTNPSIAKHTPMRLPKRTLDIAVPKIDLLNARAASLRAGGKDVISLGQALPGFPPPPTALSAAEAAIRNQDTHIYSADAGILPLRQALAEQLQTYHAIEVDAENEIIITAGANQAFMLALMTIIEPGDEVLLPSPYFMNHEMAVRAVGAIPVEAPLREEQGFALCWGDIESHITVKTRAVIIVSPSNPTGAVCNPTELDSIVRHLLARNIYVISDETYMHFVYGAEHFRSALTVSEWRNGVLMVSSFSKCFAMTGWRVGYLIAPPEIIAQAMKIQDAMIICASVVAQEAVLSAVRHNWNYPNLFLPMLTERRDALRNALKRSPRLHWKETGGGFFAFVRVTGCTDSEKLAMALIDQAHVVTIPGNYFGKIGEGFLRLSYGSVDIEVLEKAMQRLAKFLS